jgi:hypothetical protein
MEQVGKNAVLLDVFSRIGGMRRPRPTEALGNGYRHIRFGKVGGASSRTTASAAGPPPKAL